MSYKDKSKQKEYRKQWREKPENKIKKKEYDRLYWSNKDNRLRNKYKLPVGQYEIMLQDQNYSCAICLTHISELEKSLCVDHCHNTGQIRKLLCQNCNTGLGQFKDNPEILLRAINYLLGDSFYK